MPVKSLGFGLPSAFPRGVDYVLAQPLEDAVAVSPRFSVLLDVRLLMTA